MKFLKNLSVKSRLIVISIVPLLTIIYFLQNSVREELKRKNSTAKIYEEFLYVEKLSSLLHELQEERALALIYGFDRSNDIRNQITKQFASTDRAVLELRKALSENQNNTEVYDLLDSLLELRKDLASYPQKILHVRSSLLTEINSIAIRSQNAEIKNLLSAHISLLYAKEHIAAIRSNVNLAILSRGFSAEGYGEFSSLKGQYEENLSKFKRNAGLDLQTFFMPNFSLSSIKRAHVLMDSAFANPNVLLHQNAEDWWMDITGEISLFKNTSDLSLEMLRTKAEADIEEINNSVITNITLALLVMVLIAVLVFFTITNIISSISKIKNASERITKGEVDIQLNITSKDEIGDLAKSFNKMVGVTLEYARFAEQIGKGDYSSQLDIRSESDILGKALNKMREDLQSLAHENEVRTWLLSGNGKLNDIIRGEKDVLTLAGEVISQLTTYLKAQIGALYVMENGKLSLMGSYAFNHRKDNTNAFLMGEGFVGQAALEKKPILYEEIPNDYIKIKSGLGNAVPKNIIVYPFLYENEVKGVLEIGSSRQFSALDMQFLELVSNNIAIAFNGAQAKHRMKQLLEETQKQAEELEVQQEELKQSNEKLQEKTDLLEKSESEMKVQQEELQMINSELEEKANLLEEQKKVLEDAKMQIENKARELETTSKYKSEFLANMSHELRTPLNSILILSQILKENKNNILGDKEIGYATNIYNSGTDLLDLINDILDLSKVEAGRMDLDISDFMIEELCSDIKSMFEEIAKNKSVEFEVLIAEDLKKLEINTDRQRTEQILRNLLSNAFKFTESGGKVTLAINYPAPDISSENSSSPGSDIISFTVTDTGIGIPQKKLEVIFDAFQQVDGSTKRKYGGTGLGLSISKELAHTLGGGILIESEDGRGSVFKLYLPLQFDPSKIANTTHQIEIRSETSKKKDYQKKVEKIVSAPGNADDDRSFISKNDRTILIMEDDVDFASVLLDFVRERKYKGIVAYQGNTGLSYARQYKPDAIILDMKLPVMDGAEVLQQLKSDPVLRHIPVQIISGYDRKQEGLSLGAFDFIKKPVTREKLQQALDKIEDFRRKVKKLLVVEDDKHHNEAVKQLIGNGDVNCLSAYSGKEAFDMLHAHSFDCMIIDLGLPDMSGFDLLEKIKRDKNLIKIPVVIYTGKDLSREENKILEKMANTVVLKTAHSHERLLDETMLFLHRVESRLPKEKQNMIRKLHKTDEVLVHKKILVVDDDMRNVYSLTSALEEEGLECTTAGTGKEVLELLGHSPEIDIVLMDVMMPEMDGYEATREIRKLPKYSKLPIIALTAKAMKGDREKCLAAGMSDYISKPVNIEQLLSLMRVWLYK